MKSVRNREETQARLISAVGQVLAEKGFGKIGVNAVARQAGVDKVLIYRYFKDLNGLMQTYAESSNFWPTLREILGDEDAIESLKQQPFPKVFMIVFRRYAQALRSRPLTLEILAWETIDRNSLTITLEYVREKFGLELMSQLQHFDVPPADWQAIANIFTGAIAYLAIRARKISHFTGMDLEDEDSWERLLNSMEFLVSNIPGASAE